MFLCLIIACKLYTHCNELVQMALTNKKTWCVLEKIRLSVLNESCKHILVNISSCIDRLLLMMISLSSFNY